MAETLNNLAWKEIWNSSKPKLSEHDWQQPYYITHDEIKDITKREIRLLNKNSFDILEKRPPEFKKLDLFLLTHTNKQFVIVKGSEDAYFDFSKEEIQHKDEQTLNIDEYDDHKVGLSIGKSESRALDLAYIIGLIDKISDSDDDLKLTMRLRHFIKGEGFECKVGENDNNIKFRGGQYEADAVYENKDSIVIIEMKEWKKNWKETRHNIKQLYFPFRVVEKKQKELGLSKTIKCFYIFYRFLEKEEKFKYIIIDVEFEKKYYKYKINKIDEYKIQLKL